MSNCFDMSLPILAVLFQWMRLMLSPTLYSLTLAA